MNHYSVMLGKTLSEATGRYSIVHDHGISDRRFPLGAHNGTSGCLHTFFQDLFQSFDLSFIVDCVEQEIIDNEQIEAQNLLDQSFVLLVAVLLQIDESRQKLITTVIADTELCTCGSAECFGKVCLSAVRCPRMHTLRPSSINFRDDSCLGAPAGSYCLSCVSTHLRISQESPISLACFRRFCKRVVILSANSGAMMSDIRSNRSFIRNSGDLYSLSSSCAICVRPISWS